MIKITILLLVLTVIAYGICDLLVCMDDDEKILDVIRNEFPTRFYISVIAFYGLLIAFAVSLIITIVTW